MLDTASAPLAQHAILFNTIKSVDGYIGVISLNRPAKLNVLNSEMITALRSMLERWEHDNDIVVVIINAVPGRAFCAGGDMRQAVALGKNNLSELTAFFAAEYQMNSLIFHYSKPYIAFLNGIMMGGGAGIAIPGSHRVATKNLSFAMPETALGFFPDVGASFFLSRLPENIGIYLGLTGATITAADCLALKLIDNIVTETSLPLILQQLCTMPLREKANESIAQLITSHREKPTTSELMQHLSEIHTCFSPPTVEAIFAALEHYPSAWCEKVRNSLALKSPISLKVTLYQLQQGLTLSFNEALQMEYRMMCRFITQPDLYAGVQAVIIDKTTAPQWTPASISDISDAMVRQFFAPLKNELKL